MLDLVGIWRGLHAAARDLQKSHDGVSYSSTHFLLPPDVAGAVRSFAAQIPANELSEDGRESKPHVTVKYGLHTQDGRKVSAVMAGQQPARITLGPLSIFAGADSGKDYDVLKLDVDSPDLQRMNGYLCSKLPHVDTFAEYRPHITVAYLKAGEGAKYVGRPLLSGAVMLDHFIFSNADRQETAINLQPRQMLRLHKARDVSAERRIPKGQQHAGEWTGQPSLSLVDTPAKAPALSLTDSRKVETALKIGQAEIVRDGKTYVAHVRPHGSQRKRRLGAYPNMNGARAAIHAALGDAVGYTDVGAKIGGARKDIAAVRAEFEIKPTEDGLKRLEREDPAAASKSVTKSTLWKIKTVEQMKAGGAEPHAVYLAQAIHSVVGSKPDIDTPEGRERYFAGIATVRKMIDGSASFEKMAQKIQGLHDDCRAVSARQRYERDQQSDQRSLDMLMERVKAKKEQYPGGLDADRRNIEYYKARIAKRKAAGIPKVTKYQAEIMEQMFFLGDRFRGLMGLPTKGGGNQDGMTIGGRKTTLSILLRPWMERKSAITGRYSDRQALTTPEEQWQVVRTSFGKGDTFNAPVATATKERSADEQALYEERERLRAWEREAPTTYDRKGGKAVSIRRPEDYLRIFGLRGVEFGNWMDTESSRVNVERCAEAFADLADAVSIPTKELSINGRLALAFGARGHSAAAAHYEPHKTVINLTKMGGAGSLAHEWGHFMDHMLQRQETHSPSGMTMLSDVVRTTRPKNRYGGFVGAPVYSHDSPSGLAMAKVMDSIMYGEGYATTKYAPAPEKNRYRNWTALDQAYERHGKDATKALRAMVETNPTYFDEKMLKAAANYLGKVYGVTSVGLPVSGISQYYLNMRMLDEVSGGSYWSSRHELFARCFESYVQDTLGKKRRGNNYLVRNTKSAGDSGMFDPYPRGDQRTLVNAAMDELMARVRDGGALQKAYDLAKDLSGPDAGRRLLAASTERLRNVLKDHPAHADQLERIVSPAMASGVEHPFFTLHPEHRDIHEDLRHAHRLIMGVSPNRPPQQGRNDTIGQNTVYRIKSAAHRKRLSDNFGKCVLRFHLAKAKDVSGEARVPKGGKGAGEWTKTPGAKGKAPAPPPEPALPKADAAAVQARGVYDLLVSRILADPKRFQFKGGMSQISGAGEELRGVQKFDPELSGILSVWRDPANGKTYVVNGHHRLELAKRLRRRSVTVRYLEAPTAERAMIKGALINIAEGRGTPVDAAKLFRQTKINRAGLEAAGLSLKGSLADSASSLAQLCTVLWNKVVHGVMTPGRGAVIGRAFSREPEQLALNAMLERPEIKRKRLSDEAIGELAKFVDTAGRRTKTIDTLFGEESLVQNLAVEKAQVSALMKQRLSADRRLFGYVSQSTRATRLEAQGNTLVTERNTAISREAALVEGFYDKLSRFKGPISDALNAAAREVASGVSVKDAADHAYPKIREIVAGIASGRGEGHGGVAGGGDPERPHDPEPHTDGGMFAGDDD